MRSHRLFDNRWYGMFVGTLFVSTLAGTCFGQCNGGSSSMPSTGSTGSFVLPSVATSSYASSSPYYPSAYTRSAYQALAYQQQSNFKLRSEMEARQEAAKDPTSAYNTNRAERAFELAERAEKTGKTSTAMMYYKRVMKMVPETDLAKSANDAMLKLSEHDSTQLVASNSVETPR